MYIKIQCACGTKFAFEVTPVNGRMPQNVACPNCNASALDQANAEIQRQLGQVASAAPNPTPIAPPPSATAAGGLRVSGGNAPTVSIPSPAPPPPPAVSPAIPAAPRPASPAPTSMPAPPVPPPGGGLRINKPAAHAAPPASPAPESGSGEGAAEASAEQRPLCNKHKNEYSVENCRVCGKPICPKCMEQFGYLCSVYCRQQAEARSIDVPVYAHQKRVIQRRSNVAFKRISILVTVLAIVFVSLWVWYAWFARNPKMVYTVTVTRANIDDGRSEALYNEDYFLIGPGELLFTKNRKLTLYSVPQKKELWTARLQSEAEEAQVKDAKSRNEERMKLAGPNANSLEEKFKLEQSMDPKAMLDDEYFAHPRIAARTNDIWVWYTDRLERFDRKSGTPGQVSLQGDIMQIEQSGDALLVITRESTGRKLLTQINLVDGTSQNEELAPAKTVPAPATNKVTQVASAKSLKPVITAMQHQAQAAQPPKPLPSAKIAAVASAVEAPPAAEEDTEDRDFEAIPDFIPAGPNVVQLSSQMLARKTLTHEAMKAPPKKGKSVLDNENLTAGQSLDATAELLNEMQRQNTGGVEEEDVSRYQVTVHRRFANGIPDWTGQVEGEPSFFPLTTVDVVTAGYGIVVLDKSNKKLWDAKLSYRAPQNYRYFGADDQPGKPILESKDALYVADQGILTKFDLATGNAIWRLNSVGISCVQADPAGNLYLDTTTAGPDKIQYAQQIDIHSHVFPLILKVDAKTGKELWRMQSVGEHVQLSGKFVYTTRVSSVKAWLKLEEPADLHYNLDLINPANGLSIWNYHVGNHPVRHTDIQQNWILLEFGDEARVLKFWSL